MPQAQLARQPAVGRDQLLERVRACQKVEFICRSPIVAATQPKVQPDSVAYGPYVPRNSSKSADQGIQNTEAGILILSSG